MQEILSISRRYSVLFSKEQKVKNLKVIVTGDASVEWRGTGGQGRWGHLPPDRLSSILKSVPGLFDPNQDRGKDFVTLTFRDQSCRLDLVHKPDESVAYIKTPELIDLLLKFEQAHEAGDGACAAITVVKEDATVAIERALAIEEIVRKIEALKAQVADLDAELRSKLG